MNTAPNASNFMGVREDASNNASVDSRLITAFMEDNVANIITSLNEGANPNTMIEKKGAKYPILVLASYQNKPEIVTALLNKKADPDAIDNVGRTSLILASINNYKDIVTLLLENGADPNISDTYGEIPLIVASQNGNVEIVRALLKNRADPNIQINRGPNTRTGDGDTALIIASTEGHLDVVRALLENGADPNIQNIRGNTALITASSKGYVDVVRALLQNGANISLTLEKGGTAYTYAKTLEIRALIDEYDPSKRSSTTLKTKVFNIRSPPIAGQNKLYKSPPTKVTTTGKPRPMVIVRPAVKRTRRNKNRRSTRRSRSTRRMH